MADSDYVKKQFSQGGHAALSLSGTTPTSGIISPAPTLSGPWLIETQDLEIDYVRVPGHGLSVATKSITLSGAALTYGPTHSTELVAVVRANYTKSIDYNNYQVSSWQQPQLFEINAVSSDPNGVSYGTHAEGEAVGLSALGPMGSITTLQPFYRRTLYNNETLTTSSINAATFALTVSATGGLPVLHQNLYLTDYEFWKDGGCVPGTQRSGVEPDAHTSNHYMTIYGAYTYGSESPLAIRNFIDSISSYVTSKLLWTNPSPLVPPNNTIATIHNTLTGIPEYDKNRHQY